MIRPRPHVLPVTLLFLLSACSGGSGKKSFSLALTGGPAAVSTGSQTITWTSQGVSQVEIRLSSDSGASFPTVLATVPAAPGSWAWDTTAQAEGETYRLRLVGKDGSMSTLGSATGTADFALDHTAPATTLITPVGGELWGGLHTVTWSTSDAHPATVELRLSSDSGASFPTVLGTFPDTGSYALDTSAMSPATTYRLQITPTDAAGTAGATVASPADFEIDPAPRVAGPARWLDTDQNGLLGAGDELVVAFHVDVAVAGATPADLALPVAGDAFGSGASLAAGPAPNEVTVTLGSAPILRSRQVFSGTDTNAGSPSAVDVAATITAGTLTNALSGTDAKPSTPADVLPDFVPDLAWATSGGATTQGQCLADLDGDGAVDLVLSSDTATGAVWINDASGGFTDSGQTPAFGAGAHLVAADFDRDGDPDVASGCPAGTDTLFWNDGSGTLSPSGQTLSTGSTRALAAADFDGDGDLDLVAALEGAPAELWINDGAGTLAAGPALPAAVSPRDLSVGDVDGDGDLDLLVADAGGTGALWLGDGTGTFTDSGQSFGTGSAALLVDLDRDGDLDAAVGHDAAADAIWWNDGAGTFTDSGLALDTSPTTALAALDFDGDGDLDLAAAHPVQDTGIWLGDGAGGLVRGPRLQSGGSTELAVTDTDRDGDPDLLQVSGTSGARAWRDSLTGTWGAVGAVDSGQALGAAHTADVTASDLDGDGDLDLAAANVSSLSRIWLNDGTGAYTLGQEFAINTFGLDLGDLDGDGDSDLVFSDDNGPDQVWWNDGSATFTGPTLLTHSTSDNTTDVTLADVDGDGDLDILSSSYFGNTINPWRNDGGGVFTEMPTLPATKVVSLELADVDLDGDPDIVTSSYGPELVFTNDGLGTFTDSGQALGTGDTWRVAVLDADRDGDADFIATSFTGPATLWLNDGTGAFTASPQVLPSGSPTPVAGDVDGDGDTDVWFTGWSGTSSVLFLNDGTGTLTDAGFALGGLDTTDATLIDSDRDGDLDYVTGNYTGQPNRIYLNDF